MNQVAKPTPWFVIERKLLTAQELLQRYAAGERDFSLSEWIDPSGTPLRGACLDGADFSRSFVTGDFRGASLRGARFVEANVKGCEFAEADLTGADFRGAALCRAGLDGAKMEGANFAGAFWHSYEFSEGELPLS